MDHRSRRILLGSKSPRRQALIKELGFPVVTETAHVEEIYPSSLDPRKVPEYLAKLKAEPLIDHIDENDILLTSDTVVLLENEIIGKPKDLKDAFTILKRLSGKTHEVISGVSLKSLEKEVSFSEVTNVHFNVLSDEEIEFYLERFKPWDKAGSYAIQEWIGFIGVRGIQGCYYNVMGLPLSRVYAELKNF